MPSGKNICNIQQRIVVLKILKIPCKLGLPWTEVQWLTLCFLCRGEGSVPGRGTKVPHAMQCGPPPTPNVANQEGKKHLNWTSHPKDNSK